VHYPNHFAQVVRGRKEREKEVEAEEAEDWYFINLETHSYLFFQLSE
jgi:hypothetical protein